MDNPSTTDNEVVQEEIDYKALYEKAKEDLASKEEHIKAIAAKKDELLGETKKAKQEREQAEIEKSKKAGEFEKLWKEAQEKMTALEQERDNERKSYRSEKIQTNAMKIAIELADGDAQSAKLLSYFIKDKLDTLANETGHLDDSSIDAVKKDFKTNKEFAPLLAGSKATGGGAQGNTRGASNATREMMQREIDSLPPSEKVRLLREGVVVVPNR